MKEPWRPSGCLKDVAHRNTPFLITFLSSPELKDFFSEMKLKARGTANSQARTGWGFFRLLLIVSARKGLSTSGPQLLYWSTATNTGTCSTCCSCLTISVNTAPASSLKATPSRSRSSRDSRRCRSIPTSTSRSRSSSARNSSPMFAPLAPPLSPLDSLFLLVFEEEVVPRSSWSSASTARMAMKSKEALPGKELALFQRVWKWVRVGKKGSKTEEWTGMVFSRGWWARQKPLSTSADMNWLSGTVGSVAEGPRKGPDMTWSHPRGTNRHSQPLRRACHTTWFRTVDLPVPRGPRMMIFLAVSFKAVSIA
mmetsp:Transcript_4514/g.6769  ORF Transcript_4514/g.6769 Transcript_4514/m.6769 type:complete len:310 (+) Transcript_4514:398-1327(+)